MAVKTIEQIGISKLTMLDGNPRQVRTGAIQRLAKSLSGTQGRSLFEKRPCLVNKRDGKLIVYAGNQRLRAAKSLGWKSVPCIIDEISIEQEREETIKDNLVIGEWDDDILANNFDLKELEDWGMDLKELGIEPLGDEETDEVPVPPKEARAERGKVYTLGKHRVMCGDSTDAGDVELLMDGKKADMVFTSPPYNAGNNSLGGNKNLTERKYLNDNDDKPQLVYFELLKSFLSVYQKFSQYQFVNIQSLSGNKLAIIDLLTAFRDHFVDVAIWHKGGGQPAMQESVLNSRFEFIYIFSSELNPTRQIKTNKFRNISNVFELNPSGKNEFKEIHAATFPVAFADHFLTIGSPRDGIVVDSFCGVGSTLIAAEKNNRICYGMEIDPKYVDVIIERYCNYVGCDKEDIYMQVVPEGTEVGK